MPDGLAMPAGLWSPLLAAVPNWVLGLAALGVGVAFWYWYLRWYRRQIAVSRIPTRVDEEVRSFRVRAIETPFERILPWVLGLAAGLISYFSTPLGTFFAISIGILFFVIGILIKATLTGRRSLMLEAQLAQAIDHVVTSLHAGIGVLDALASAEHSARQPFKPYLTAMIVRIRLGDDPVEVCKEMANILPLESFRLFYYALAVQWEGGGNLAPTLATTGRFIRDRVEVGRRVRAQTTEARGSVMAVLALTYFLALLMWHVSADRMEGFLSTEIGRYAAGGAIILQALGAAWTSRMARIKF